MSALPDHLRSTLEGAGLRPVDIALADWGWRHNGGRPGALGLALANHAIGLGHTCLPLDRLGDALGEPARLVEAERFAEELPDNPLVAAPDAAEPRPLMLDGARLYLQRYWDYERRLAERVCTLLAAPPAAVDTAALGPDGGLFDYDWTPAGATNWQAVAAFAAQRHRFAVISGGPGTGKTYTIVRLMIRLVEAALAAGERPPVFRLAAPTGKAAARMYNSVLEGLAALDPRTEAREHLPHEATTLHRLLRLRWGSTTPGHDREQPIPTDVVIVDEASMIDLPLMSKLVDAIPDSGRLILLGDRYQLASVESGSVLADLCTPAGVNAFSDAQIKASDQLITNDSCESTSPLSDHVVTLQTSHRFSADSPIGRLAAAINAGDPDAVRAVLDEGNDEMRATLDTSEASLQTLVDELADAYDGLHVGDDPLAALDTLERTRLLTVTRIGPLGSEAMNQRVAVRLAQRHGFDPDGHWYPGRHIMVVQNDPRAGLYNGDVGVIRRDDEGRVRAWFRAEDGVRSFHPSLLPQHETAYAMTVHKSQGSEFDTVYLLLPQASSALLTRELLYTAVTRPRRHLRAYGSFEAWHTATHHPAARFSGLVQRLTET